MAFDIILRTKVTFGAGTLARVPEELRRLGVRRPLIVTDPGIANSGLLAKLTQVLSGAEIPFTVFDGVRPNPSTSIIEQAARVYAAEGCDGVVALGGGSSIDTGKGVAILVTSGGRVRDYAGYGKVQAVPAPVLAIPTTAGTGAEVSNAIAVTDDERHTKFAVRAPLVAPIAAILDPSLLATLPARIAAETAMDTLCHLIEAFVSRGASPFTDLLSEEGIRLCGRSLTAFVSNRSNAAAASDMLYAAMLGGIVISLARTGAAHTLTRPLGDRLSHGLANAVVLPHVMRYNLSAAPDKFIRVARALGRPVEGTDLRAASAAVDVVEEIQRTLGLPTRLRDLGIQENEIPELARQAHELEISRLNPRDLGPGEIELLLRAAY